ELPCRGPVFTADTHLRILGDVPDNCTVVVSNEASCAVDGYVMGRILAKNHCEVRQNISGVAIVLRGHIRARSIINNALVVAKMGSVICNNAQGPKLIFAGRSIYVNENTMLGKFITREMVVEGEVRGGHLEIAGNACAKAFRHLGMSNLAIVLRRELSCEDFGEITGDDLRQLLSQAYTLRRKAHNFRNMANAARRETDHAAQSALMYIFGGGEVQKRLKGFLRAQRQHILVSNVVDNLQSILEQAQDSLTGSERGDEVRASHFAIEDELDQDNELIAARADAEKFQKSLHARNLNRKDTGLILDQVRQKLFEMCELQQKMAEKVREEERSVQHLEKYEQVLAGSGEGTTKLEALNKILPAMKKQPPESPMGKRLRSGFIVRALRTVDRAARHASEFGAKADQYLQDFHAASERLGRDYQIHVLENPESEEEGAQVTGVFDSGTRIFMDRYVENIMEAAPDAVVSTPEDKGVRTYGRAGSGSRFRGGSGSG
ncbi:MAG: hypothetical protein L3K26_18180, partial [Candidatus Hydrogenedentes bacterium]|nr:hypothetical protein [Candidatus Hydrogenedentota bacterium]